MQISRATTVRLLTAAGIAALVLLPTAASAVSWIPVVPCGTENTPTCNPCHLLQTGKNFIDLILLGVTGPLAAFMVVLAGGMMLLGGGNPAMFSNGRRYLTNTFIGVGIILIAWAATNFLIKGLGSGSQGDSWFEFTCPEGLAAISAIDTQFASPVAGVPRPPTPIGQPALAAPAGIGKACPDDSLPRCGTAADLNVTCGSCDNVRAILQKPGDSDVFQKYARGFVSAGLLESIMLNESSCGRNLKSPAGAYGPMQFLPSRANMYTGACGIVTVDEEGNERPARINGAWLMNEANWEASICLAAAYTESLVNGSCGPDYRHVAAGYNGGPGACELSISCQGLDSCGGGPIRRWECAWENTAHTSCNANRAGGGYSETRGYAPKVAACESQL